MFALKEAMRHIVRLMESNNRSRRGELPALVRLTTEHKRIVKDATIKAFYTPGLPKYLNKAEMNEFFALHFQNFKQYANEVKELVRDTMSKCRFKLLSQVTQAVQQDDGTDVIAADQIPIEAVDLSREDKANLFWVIKYCILAGAPRHKNKPEKSFWVVDEWFPTYNKLLKEPDTNEHRANLDVMKLYVLSKMRDQYEEELIEVNTRNLEHEESDNPEEGDRDSLNEDDHTQLSSDRAEDDSSVPNSDDERGR